MGVEHEGGGMVRGAMDAVPEKALKAAAGWKTALSLVKQDVVTAEMGLHLKRSVILATASKHTDAKDTNSLPDREIVSISIFNSGAADEGTLVCSWVAEIAAGRLEFPP